MDMSTLPIRSSILRCNVADLYFTDRYSIEGQKEDLLSSYWLPVPHVLGGLR